jgi:nitronate monooxygenase
MKYQSLAGPGLNGRCEPAKPPALRLGDLLAPASIVQGGMGVGVSLSGLAAAVANAGGIGVIATAGIGWDEPDLASNFREANLRALRRHIRAARAATDGVIGVNIMVALTNYEELVRTAAEEGADVIFSGAGLPLSLPGITQGADSPKLAPIVSSGRAADILCRKWSARYGRLPDAVVVEGPLAGGHLGFKPEHLELPEYSLERLLPAVVSAVAPFEASSGRSIPVIAAGGVYTGGDVLRMMRLGASGCQLGTRFVATHECDVSMRFKQRYIDAERQDIRIIQSPVGMPGRAIANHLVQEAEQGRRRPESCRLHCLHGCQWKQAAFCISDRLIRARCGDVDEGLVFAGANAWRVQGLVSVRELMDDLLWEYAEQALADFSSEPEPAVAAAG